MDLSHWQAESFLVKKCFLYELCFLLANVTTSSLMEVNGMKSVVWPITLINDLYFNSNLCNWVFRKGEKFPQAHFAHVQISPMKFDVMTNRGQLVFNVTFVWAALLLFTTKNVHLFAHKILKAKISPFSTSWMWPHLYSVTLWAKCCCFFLHNFFLWLTTACHRCCPLSLTSLTWNIPYRTDIEFDALLCMVPLKNGTWC